MESEILNDPAEYVVLVPLEKCACTSAALGPVYVITPLLLLYDKEPSPPLSVTEMADLALASVKYKLLPSAKSVVLVATG